MGFLRNLVSTRSAMQKLPPMDEIHYITDEELKQLQDCFLEIIKDVDRVCEENGICYIANGGTCLGAVRHGGFIPWDDDVDLMMPREDLKRFLEIFDSTLGDKYEITSPDSKYQLESLITAMYMKGTIKASVQTMHTDLPQGVHIDIFPIENIPKNKIVRGIKGSIAIILQYIAVSSLLKAFSDDTKKQFFYQTKAGKINYNLRMFIAAVFSFRSYDKWCTTFDRFVQCKKDTGLWGIPTDVGHYFGHVMPKEVYYPPVKCGFCDMQLNIPHDKHTYLVNAYGDYMRIPPVEEREQHWSIGFDLNPGDKTNE